MKRSVPGKEGTRKGPASDQVTVKILEKRPEHEGQAEVH